MYDIAIIGGGVVGALTARELSRYDLKICLLERAADVAAGASSANSGIVHSGFDASEGSLKALYNVAGNSLMKNTVYELGVKYENNASLVLAFSQEEDDILVKLKERGYKNDVKNIDIIRRDEIKKLEKNVCESVTSALLAKSGAIVCPYELTIAAAGNAIDNGAVLLTNFEVAGIEKDKKGFTLCSSKGEKIECRAVINCAGIYADKVAQMIGDNSFKIYPKKGEYILLDRECAGFVSSTVFTCPSEKGKGVLVSPTVDGNIIVGPTSVLSDDKEDNSVSAEAFVEIIEKAKKIFPKLPLYNTITSFCGIRASSDRNDFIVEFSKTDERFIHIAGIESPGLTAAPALAKKAAQMAVSLLGAVKEKSSFDPFRKSDSFFKDLTLKEKNELIKADGNYGRIVCRCEQVTMGEILFAINRNPKAETIDAVKRRTRAGMGRCQGGFCQPAVADVFKTYCGLDYKQITKSGEGSWIFSGKIK